MMNDIVKVLSDKAAISNWEDEGSALKPLPITEVRTHTKAIFVCLGGLIAVPFFYWLVKKQFQT